MWRKSVGCEASCVHQEAKLGKEALPAPHNAEQNRQQYKMGKDHCDSIGCDDSPDLRTMPTKRVMCPDGPDCDECTDAHATQSRGIGIPLQLVVLPDKMLEGMQR
mmetsp:Transcript_29939/g.58764  ORF Transcript_29939/g.58764 Transcript_29939/m.58764 type:complete len:105 (+) Transcript_29939:646-960(+)